MKVKSVLEDASLESITTSSEAAANKSRGRVYINFETWELLIGDGSSFKRRQLQSDSAVGELKTSILEEGIFQSQLDTTWLLCNGQTCNGTDYSRLIRRGTSSKGTPKTYPLQAGGFGTKFYLEAVSTGQEIDDYNDAQLALPIPGPIISHSITLAFDGVQTFQQTIDAWNVANPDNMISQDPLIIYGSGSDVYQNGTTLNFEAYTPDTRSMTLRGYQRLPLERQDGYDMDSTRVHGEDFYRELGGVAQDTAGPHKHKMDLFVGLGNGQGIRPHVQWTGAPNTTIANGINPNDPANPGIPPNGNDIYEIRNDGEGIYTESSVKSLFVNYFIKVDTLI